MKKITLLTAILVSFAGFSQANKQKIQAYLEQNRAKLQLSSQDIADWVIESEVQGSGTGITSTYIVQRHQGIEIFNAQNNVWIKTGEVLNMPDNNFKSNIASKINVTSPSLTVLQAISAVYSKIGNTKTVNFSISETLNNKSFKLSDGLSDEVISAKLVYQYTTDNKLKLSWAFQFYAPTNGDLLDLRIDAVSGKILEQNNLTISCNFGNHDHLHSKKEIAFSFEKLAFKIEKSTIVAAPPGVPGQYRVIPYNFTSPNHSPFELITTTGNILAAPNGWHNSNGLTDANAGLRFTYTRGNNVWARQDAIGDNGTTIYPNVDGTASLTFDFPYVNQNQQPNEYTGRSTTNLFYMNNVMHDVWYQYGFTEASGNFQKDNYGRATGVPGVNNSATGDFVFADSQDGYLKTTQDLNNANFSTPGDGVRPRMQMFMWNSNAPPLNLITINAPNAIAGVMVAKENNFEGTDKNPVPVSPGITRSVALFTNNKVLPAHSGNSGCQPATNPLDLNNKIVLIRRGGCFFKDKVFKAQLLGAAAVIIMDSIVNQPDSNLPDFYPGPVFMGSTGLNGITIPAISVTKQNGDALVAALLNGPMEIKLENPADQYRFADGSFDNTIIAHEYGHGISNKLIGGPANSSCMTNLEQMGEGWSDWFGLMMQLKTGDVGATPVSVGTFVQNEPNNGGGIRQYPYSTNMTVNPLTLAGSNNTNTANTGYRYTVGEFWATVLWDLNWAYINKYGYDADIYNGTGGNNRVMRLVLDALKLQACNTATLISGRDLLFAAELATTNGADYDMIRAVFTRRGMGLNASSGDPALPGDQVEDFTPFPLAALANDSFFSLNSSVRVYPNPANNSVNVRVGGLEGKINMQIVDLNGRVIFDQNDEKFNSEKTIDLSNLRSGIYMLNLKGNNLNYTQKLIKN